MAADKVDLFRELKAQYVAKQQPVLVEITPATYLTVEGSGPPGGDEFQDRIGALYGVAYTVKMTRKFAGRRDYVVCKLEAQYEDFAEDDLEDLRWRFLIRTPDFVKKSELEDAVRKLLEKGKSETVREVRLQTIDEGRCVQMLHVGPYDEEQRTLDEMNAFMESEGLVPDGLHHEIYLSDPRRVAPEKLRTIIRLPVAG